MSVSLVIYYSYERDCQFKMLLLNYCFLEVLLASVNCNETNADLYSAAFNKKNFDVMYWKHAGIPARLIRQEN